MEHRGVDVSDSEEEILSGNAEVQYQVSNSEEDAEEEASQIPLTGRQFRLISSPVAHAFVSDSEEEEQVEENRNYQVHTAGDTVFVSDSKKRWRISALRTNDLKLNCWRNVSISSSNLTSNKAQGGSR